MVSYKHILKSKSFLQHSCPFRSNNLATSFSGKAYQFDKNDQKAFSIYDFLKSNN